MRELLHISYKAMSRGANISPRWEVAMKFVGEADRLVEIKGFLMAGSCFLAPETYVRIVRYVFFDLRQQLNVLYNAMSRGANISPRWEDAMK